MTRPSYRPVDQAAALDGLYAKVPTIDCQGFCWDSCGRIGMSRAEDARIVRETGVQIPDGTRAAGPAVCVALTMLRRCSVYEIRPLICRLWGVIKSMPCTFGCRPERYLSDAEAYELIAQAYDIAGQHEEADATRAPWATPELAARTEAGLRAQRRDREVAYEVRERRAIRDGSVVYVHGPGQFAKSSAHRGDRRAQ